MLAPVTDIPGRRISDVYMIHTLSSGRCDYSIDIDTRPQAMVKEED